MRELKNQLSINEEWCPASDGGTFQVLNSTPEKIITNAPVELAMTQYQALRLKKMPFRYGHRTVLVDPDELVTNRLK